MTAPPILYIIHPLAGTPALDRLARRLSISMIRRLHEQLGISTEVLIRPSRQAAQ